ncbi:hypothetical protein RUM44_000862 [Polyplax serrata]|uniref:Proteasome assembly chaperone 4 n=1 Tax=Polyplax serrata TaxID=468196 RepID=A0ABR1B8U7_POLSC
MESSEEVTIEHIEPNIKIHAFAASVAENVVRFEVMKFKDSVLIWIGQKQNRCFKDLSLALLSNKVKDPLCTKIMGQPTDLTSNNLACKLSKKLGKPVYVSFNLVDDRLTVPVVNSRIIEEMQKNPQCF